MRRQVLVLTALAVLAAVPAATAARKGSNLSVVAYSIPTNVFPKLEAAYGNGVTFAKSFAASEAHSKAVAADLPAEVANCSIASTGIIRRCAK